MAREYTLSEKYEAVVAYMMYGTYSGAGKALGFPPDTIRDWAKTEWWEDMMQRAISDVNAALRATGLKIVNKATEAILDRLDNGDEVSDRNGNMMRRKVSLKDALLASLTWFDKTRIINEQRSKYSQNKVDPKSLMKEMIALGAKLPDKEQQAPELIQSPLPKEEEDLVSSKYLKTTH